MRRCFWCFVLVLTTAIVASPQPAQHNETAEKPRHSNTDATPVEDPLGRSTPHGTVFGFLHLAQSGKYKEAAEYLQLSGRERAIKGERIAKEFHLLMDNAFVGRVGAISNHKEGSVQPGVPQDHERIGTFKFNGNETEVDLVHVTDASGAEIWLFSSQLLAVVPELSGEIEGRDAESRLPPFLSSTRFFSTPLWRLIALGLLIPVSFAIAWSIVQLLRAGLRLWVRRRNYSVVEDVRTSFVGPTILILTVAFIQIGIYVLGTPLLIREYYRRSAGIVLVIGVTWLVVRVINRWGERARLRSLSGSGFRSGSMILLGQRIFNVFVIIVAGLVILSILGVDITAAVAGLGIGSIAIAFAAQKTLENLLGGISILGDQVIRVGEICRVGDHVGKVEDISLRSTRIRTLDGTALSVPNGQLANMNVENISRREKSLFEAMIGLRSDTTADQLRLLLSETRGLLLRHPEVDPTVARVHFTGFGESSLDLKVHCLIKTGKLAEFLAVREDLLLQIMELVARAGIELSTPARLLHITQEEKPDHPQAVSAPSVVRPRARG